jgi:flagellin
VGNGAILKERAAVPDYLLVIRPWRPGRLARMRARISRRNRFMATFSVVSNVASMNAQANLVGTSLGLNKALTRLSSGFRINMSGDDAAGLAVANRYRSDVAIIGQGIRNANDGLSELQIKDGALNNIANLLDRLATLATQSASGLTTAAQRTILDSEATDLLAEIDREAEIAGLDVDAGVNFSVFVSNDTGNETISSTSAIQDVDTNGLGITALDLATQANAQTAIGLLTAAIGTLGAVQGQVGTLQNRLQFAVTLAQSQLTNKKAAESRIRDANVAEESANMTRFNILSQTGIAALAQANQASASVLSLLR